MAEEFWVKGLEQFKRLAEVLRVEGSEAGSLSKGVKKQFSTEMRKAGAPLTAGIRDAYREKMPRAGGLNERLASAKVGVRNRYTGQSAGTTVVVTVPGYDLDAVEKGQIRHPVFGHGPWVSQEVPEEVAGHVFEEMQPEIQARADVAIEKVIADIAEEA